MSEYTVLSMLCLCLLCLYNALLSILLLHDSVLCLLSLFCTEYYYSLLCTHSELAPIDPLFRGLYQAMFRVGTV